MNILHYKPTIRLQEGGVVRAVLDLCTGFAANNHDVTLATCDPTDTPTPWKEGQPNCPRVHTLPKPAARGGRFASGQLGEIAELIDQADILHLHAVWQPTNLQLAKLARKTNTPYIVSVHGMLDDWTIGQKHLKKRLFLALGGSAYLANAAMVHTTAKAELSQAKKWIGGASGSVVPLIFDLSDFAVLPGPEAALAKFSVINTHVPRLLFLSRIHYKKGVDRLLKAAAILRDRNIDFQLLIAGTGDEHYTQQMQQLCDSLCLHDFVNFLGFVRGVEKISLYQASTCFCLPTSQENFGFVYFEALACGCPVVTTRGTDTWPEIQQSGAGVIAENEPEAFANAIAAWLDQSQETQRKRAHKARQWTLEFFDTSRILQAYEAMYEQAIHRNHS